MMIRTLLAIVSDEKLERIIIINVAGNSNRTPGYTKVAIPASHRASEGSHYGKGKARGRYNQCQKLSHKS